MVNRTYLLLFLLPVLFCASLVPVARSQVTTVTGTVIDPNGNPYANGTASAFKVVPTGQSPGTPVNVSTNSFGSFSMPLPSPASYQFTVCAPPVNIGPRANPVPTQVCFSSGPIPVSGGSLDVTASLGTPPLLGPGGGSITTVSSLPNGNGIYLATSCPAFTPNCFKIFDDVNTDLNAVYASGSATVVTSSQAVPFTANDVGKIIWGASNCGAGAPAVTCIYNLPQGTILTVNGAHSVTASTTAIANSGAGNNPLFWGHDDGSQLVAAYAAMIANALYGPASSLTIPCGVMFTSLSPFIQPSVVVASTYGIQGCGGGGTVIMPLPKMNCTGGATKGCLLNTIIHGNTVGSVQAGGHFRDLVFYGGGLDAPDSGATFDAGTSGVYIGGDDSIDNVWVLGWLWNNSVVNPGITNAGGLMINSGTLAGGRDGCLFNNAQGRISQMFGGSCGGSHVSSITFASGIASTYGVFVNPASGFFTSVSVVNSGATWYSHGDNILGDLQTTGGSTYLTGTELNQSGAGGSPINANGGIIHLQNVHISSSGAPIAQTSGTVFDDCGNGPFNSAASTITNLYGDCSITGIADVAGNHALTSGWGTANVNTVTGSTRNVRFTVSITGGVPGASPVLTDTFAVPFLTTPGGGCSLIQIGGTFGVITNPVPSSLSRTGVTWTFSGTPVNGQSYSFARRCTHD